MNWIILAIAFFVTAYAMRIIFMTLRGPDRDFDCNKIDNEKIMHTLSIVTVVVVICAMAWFVALSVF